MGQRTPYSFLFAITIGVVCATVTGTEARPKATVVKLKGVRKMQTSQEQPTPVTLKLVTVEDPVERAYTIGMPEGWTNRTYSAREFDIHSTVDITISPNGSVLIFAGDPSIPQFWSPHAANEMTYFMARFNRKMRIEPFRPADAFFPGYVQQKYGKLPGFKITASGADRDLQQRLQARLNQAGIAMTATAARVSFTYQDGGRPMRGLLLGQCCDSGAFWIPTVQGITTSGDPETYVPMIDAMGKTRKTNPHWQAQQAQRHQEAMAQIQWFGQMMTNQHQQNMAMIQQSAQSHQQRIQALQSQADANTRAFNERMASSDARHRGFLNFINEEETVITSGGKRMQVAAGYERYFVHRTDRTYIGGDHVMTLERLRELNLNPSDYEEVKISR